ncbi:CAAX protease [Streptococcus salivarius]|uniref:CAAX protease n=1 Tax=Streptococcus salivarius TaxID=1304 RepID=UPI00319DADD2
MLIKMLVGKRKTEDEFKKYITRVACSLFCLGVLGLFVVRSNNLSDYALGLVLGFTIGVYVLSIYYFATLTRPKRLHRMYIAAYDERNKQILMATAVATLILEFLLIFALIVLYAFVNIQLPYVTVLSVLLYGLVLGFALIRLILSKIG